KLVGKGESGAEVEIDRLIRLDHLVEESCLGLVFDVADGERADADCLGSGDRLAVVFDADAFDASRRHGIYVGGDEKIGRLLELVSSKQPAPRGSSREDDLCSAGEFRLLLLGRAVGIAEIDLKAHIGLFGKLAYAL